MSLSTTFTLRFDGDAVRRGLRGVGESIKSLGSAAMGIAKAGAAIVAFGVGAAAGIAAVALKLNSIGEEARQSDARLKNVTESMGLFGDKADDVSDRLLNLADNQGRMLGIDDDVIALTQSKLMTFKELASTADKMGGSFDRATMAALDMAGAGFGTAEMNAVQLGKALNDPIKGINSLTKSGITFTEAEKDKIKMLVDSSGMLAEASKKSAELGAEQELLSSQLKSATRRMYEMRSNGDASTSSMMSQKDKIDLLTKKLAENTEKRRILSQSMAEMSKNAKDGNGMLKAQDIILKSIETQVGGTAKATATASGKMKVSMAQLVESFAKPFSEGFNSIPGMLEKMFPIIQARADEMGKLFGVAITDAVNGDYERFALIGELIGTAISGGIKVGAKAAGRGIAQSFWEMLENNNPLRKTEWGAKQGKFSTAISEGRSDASKEEMAGLIESLRTKYGAAQSLRSNAPAQDRLTPQMRYAYQPDNSMEGGRVVRVLDRIEKHLAPQP